MKNSIITIIMLVMFPFYTTSALAGGGTSTSGDLNALLDSQSFEALASEIRSSPLSLEIIALKNDSTMKATKVLSRSNGEIVLETDKSNKISILSRKDGSNGTNISEASLFYELSKIVIEID